MKLIVINGPSCSGKSSVAKGILSKHSKLFHLWQDRLRWLISDYQADRDYKLVQKLTVTLAETVFAAKYDAVFDAALYRKNREAVMQKATECGYTILEINLEADFEILKERFMERVDKKKQDPSARISNTSLERFKELNEVYNREKNVKATTLDSGDLSVEEIVDKISQLQ